MKALVANNLSKYEIATAKHNELLSLIEAINLTIYDLHQILKIVKTLLIIEQYQKDNLPNTNAIERFIKQQDITIKLADSLSKK